MCISLVLVHLKQCPMPNGFKHLSVCACRALARKNGYQLAYNQEIVALGIANFAGALFSSYTTTGSFSRSAINNSCGAKTQLSGFVTSIIVMCVLLFLVSWSKALA